VCVIVTRQGDSILIGNSGQPAGPFNSFSRAEWKEFLVGAKLGDFDEIA